MDFLEFQSTSSARRTTGLPRYYQGRGDISIHVLREEDDVVYRKNGRLIVISIHVLREEDDRPDNTNNGTADEFQSTSSARRTTRRDGVDGAGSRHFNPRPPRGGRPNRHEITHAISCISIHVLREEDDRSRLIFIQNPQISIHVLREEDDARSEQPEEGDSDISIHVLREEDDC